MKQHNSETAYISMTPGAVLQESQITMPLCNKFKTLFKKFFVKEPVFLIQSYCLFRNHLKYAVSDSSLLQQLSLENLNVRVI